MDEETDCQVHHARHSTSTISYTNCLGVAGAFFAYQPPSGGGLLSRYSGHDRPLLFVFMHGPLLDGRVMIP